MKVLFAVENEGISNSIVKKYQKEYKEILASKNVYYFNAILKELQKDKTYDAIVISETLEQFANSNTEQMDKFIFEKLDGISDEAVNTKGEDIPIILICSERREKGENLLVKIFGLGIYNAIIGEDRNIDEVCRLINRPRSKKEAKIYYKIDTDEVNYQPESENDVSEIEIQNILAHYKRLGKNEEKYVESFSNISTQYNDIQLKIICNFLPLNVRAVLEEKSPKYQALMASPGGEKIKSTKGVKKNNEGTTEKLLGLKEKDIKAGGQQIIVPKAKTTARKIESNEAAEKKVEQPKAKVETRTVEERPVQKAASRTVEEKPVQKTAPKAVEEKVSTKQVEPKASKKVEEIEEQPVKRGRGRPKKVVTEEAKEETSKAEKNEENQPVKRGRGRPKKVVEEDKEEEEVPARKGKRNLPEEDDEENILPGFGEDSEEEEEENILPGFGESSEEEEEENVLPGFEEDSEEDEEENVLPGFGEDSEEDEEENTLPGFEEDDESEQYDEQEQYNEESARNSILSKAGQEETEGEDLSSLLTESKKIVTFVGSPKNGTSFIVNNLAELLSSMGINTAILDMTRSKNSYYIYTRNEEELRKIAFTCMNNLKNGRANGIQANKNLTIYTSLPTEDDYNSEITILETLVRKHDLILIDCDYETPLEYFRQSQEIYLVQSMDILTIQPLTAFLKTLKERNILNERKLKIIINKYLKLKTISEKIIVGGMSSYNDPAMSFMTNLFDRSRVSYITIPFDEEIYVNYLDGVVNCDISLKNYLKSSKKFMQNLKQLGNMVYPYDKRGASGMRR